MENLLSYYQPLDEIEKIQQKTGVFVEEFEVEKNLVKNQKLKLEEWLFFNHQPILIRKHRRFAAYPLHSHQFLEFNYMLAGKSHQIVNGRPLILREKQLLLLDTNSEHQLAPLGEEDILINFLFKTDKLNIDILKKN